MFSTSIFQVASTTLQQIKSCIPSQETIKSTTVTFLTTSGDTIRCATHITAKTTASAIKVSISAAQLASDTFEFAKTVLNVANAAAENLTQITEPSPPPPPVMETANGADSDDEAFELVD